MASIQSVLTAGEPERRFGDLDLDVKKFVAKSTMTLFAIMIAVALLLPLAFMVTTCLLYTSPSPRDATLSRMPSSA